LEATEVLGHAGREVAVLGVGGCFLEGSETVFALIVLFFTRVTAIRTFRTITTVVCSTMSKVRGLVSENRRKCDVLCVM
jgi:hypothetical protein